MYNLLKKIIYTCTLASLYAYSPSTLANEYTVIDHKFSMTDPSFGDLNTPMGANITGSTPWGTIVEGVYQGTNSTNDIVSFDFFGAGNEVNVYTAAVNQGSTNTAAGTVTGGPAPTIDLGTLTADMSSWFATWSGTEFLQGNNNQWAACAAHGNFGFLSSVANVTDNLDGTYIVDWNSCITGGAFNGQIGFWQLTLRCDVGCAVVNPGLADTLAATQFGQPTRTVETGTVVDVTSPLDGAANHTFDWVTNVGIADADGTADDGNYQFTPTTVGNYTFTSTWEDATNFPISVDKGVGSIVIKVIAPGAGIDTGDTDNNGIINEYDDAALVDTQLQAELSNSASYVMSSDKGELKLGLTAFCAGTAARASLTDMASFAGDNCTAVTTASDDDSLIGAGTGGYHDFEVHGLTAGEAAQIVIPLNTSLPSNAVYRKFDNKGNAGLGAWGTFITGDGDLLASAMATSTGVCPAPGSASYTNGLTAGDNCMQVTITDGGLNDTDGAANGQIIDPGTIAKIKSGTEANLASGCSISGKPGSLNQHSEWLLIATFITWLGFISYRRKQTNK